MGQSMKYLFDTNILIYYFNGSLSDRIKDLITEMMKNNFSISIISKMEFLGFNRFSIADLNKAKHFLSYAQVLPLENAIVEHVIEMKQSKNIKLPDAIIAVTAIIGNFHLVTRNIDDFKNIDIKLINPFSDVK